VRLQISEVNHFGNGESRYIASETATAPDLDAFALLADEDAEAVMLDFVQPTGSGGRAINERGFAGADEADRRYSCPAGRGGAPRRTRSNHEAEAAVASARSVVACATLRAR
jgi:hypothetical protein